MTNYERRFVHDLVATVEGIRSKSVGAGACRRVAVWVNCGVLSLVIRRELLPTLAAASKSKPGLLANRSDGKLIRVSIGKGIFVCVCVNLSQGQSTSKKASSSGRC
ncbi:MAG: hypothetical protein LBJ38_02655 [Oscillospiraceae bacterium]|nr:hypothetical protein [Oscillospiraceae bacterium]